MNSDILMVMQTLKERNRLQRIRRKKNGNVETHRYEKTPKGFLMRKYRNMESRVKGIQYKKAHLYKGLYLLPRKDFYNWAIPHIQFHKLYVEWIDSGYNRKLCPTVDRINTTKGYEISNMRWITHSENSRLGSIHRNQLRKLKI
jgi:hypothetical protein